ncbi:acylphosphatase [Mycetocola sp. CAN_C7]|uniref:acylphosphatase n=1 Tax=Mycetocola sp. CAN_C7 TaxID=2787724 RepID=UPI0018C9CAC6
MGDIRRGALVHGRVHGVGFRYWTRGEAERLGVSGWVRNRDDGTVEAEIEGDQAAVTALIRLLSLGPDGAVVERVDISDLTTDGGSGFRISATGARHR